MPRLEMPSEQTQVFSSNGSWVCPGDVTYVLAVTTGTGSFNGIAFIGSGYLHSVVPGTSYPLVVSSGTITLHWFAVR
jgi:hypothetical protein